MPARFDFSWVISLRRDDFHIILQNSLLLTTTILVGQAILKGNHPMTIPVMFRSKLEQWFQKRRLKRKKCMDGYDGRSVVARAHMTFHVKWKNPVAKHLPESVTQYHPIYDLQN